MKQTILITGANGFVGSVFASLLAETYTIVAPSRDELDITQTESVISYFSKVKPNAVVHCAAFTDNTRAEMERRDVSGECYRVNVLGTSNIAAAIRDMHLYGIYVSTGSVFSGNAEHPGPFSEKDAVSPDEMLSWYGVTKKIGEQFILPHGAVIRLSHPLYGPFTNHYRTGGDYLRSLLLLHKRKQLYPLFTDQYFPVTDLAIAAQGVSTLVANRSCGVFHMVSDDVVSPYELCLYALKTLGRDTHELQTISFDDYLKRQTLPARFTKYSGITGVNTRKYLGIPAYSWQDVANKNMSYYEK